MKRGCTAGEGSSTRGIIPPLEIWSLLSLLLSTILLALATIGEGSYFKPNPEIPWVPLFETFLNWKSTQIKEPRSFRSEFWGFSPSRRQIDSRQQSLFLSTLEIYQFVSQWQSTHFMSLTERVRLSLQSDIRKQLMLEDHLPMTPSSWQNSGNWFSEWSFRCENCRPVCRRTKAPGICTW